MIKKRMAILFSLLLLVTVVGAGCSKEQNSNSVSETNSSANEQVENKVSVDLLVTMDDGSITYPTMVSENASVLDVIQTVSDENNLELETKESSLGVYVNGFMEKTGGDNDKYWLYYVNGESATVGVADYIIKEGDIIEFKFE